MKKFQHANDRISLVNDREQFTYAVSEFLLDEPSYAGLPGDAILHCYVPYEQNFYSNGSKQWSAGVNPWFEGDQYLSKISVYQAAYVARHTPVIAPQSFNIAAGSPNGTVVGTLVASHPMGLDLSYAISQLSPVFEVNADTGEITVLDTNILGPAGTVYDDTARATEKEGAGFWSEAAATITVTA